MPKSVTTKPLLIFAAALAMLMGCSQTTPYATETEAALCDVWADTLILPSRADTEETARALNRAVQMHEAVCS